jgi:ribonuclease-3
MPASIRDRKVIKPLSYFGFSEIKQQANEMEPNNLLTFADAHGEARSQLALIGDTVLNLATSLHLIRQHPFLSTGIITERRSQLVCNHNLAQVWSSLLGLGEMVLCEPLLWTSPKLTSNSFKDQTKAFADTLEAYIGGIYIEKGPDSAMWCVESRLLPLLLLADPIRNPVAALKEQSELTFQVKPEYKLIGVDNKHTALEAYRIRVYVKGIRMATGIGKSQKLAKRDAAEKALTKWIDLFGAA